MPNAATAWHEMLTFHAVITDCPTHQADHLVRVLLIEHGIPTTAADVTHLLQAMHQRIQKLRMPHQRIPAAWIPLQQTHA